MHALAATPSTTRDVLIDVAERAFADRGYGAASMRDIAADAGLRNQASVYHHFPHKQALYEAVLTRVVDELLPLFGAAGGDTSLAGTLIAVVDHLATRPHLAALVQRAGIDDDPAARDAVMRLLRPLFDAGVEALASRAGGWQRGDLPHVASGIYHLIFGYFASAELLGKMFGEDARSARALGRQRRFVVRAVEHLLDEREETARGGSRT